MSKSLETAQKIMDHLEHSKAPNRGISGAIGKMQRREYQDAVSAIANIIDGKPAVEEKAADAPKAAASGAGGGAPEASKAGGKAAPKA